MSYWLFKSEPITYGIDHLNKDKTTPWEGVRNYQARNYMKEACVGDMVLFYHSNTKVPAVVGLAEVCSKPHPDLTQFNKKSGYYDDKASKDKPRWFCVDVKFVEKFKNEISLEEIKKDKLLSKMKVAEQGSRLSITPVSKKEFEKIIKLSSK